MLVLLVVAGVFGVLSFLIGEFDDWQWKILGTLFVLVSLCIGLLSNSLLFSTRYAAAGATGIFVSALATASLLTLIWLDYSAIGSSGYTTVIEPMLRFAGITVTFSLASVITSLLLHLTRHGVGIVSKLVWTTIGFVLADTLIITLFVLSPDLVQDAEFLLRLLGATSVLATVGIVATPIMALMTKGKKQGIQGDHAAEVIEPTSGYSSRDADLDGES